jgi:hypothetical protein
MTTKTLKSCFVLQILNYLQFVCLYVFRRALDGLTVGRGEFRYDLQEQFALKFFQIKITALK